ncbi:Ankyrin repeats (3 copies) [Caballeronia peredens]|nr:Ankyrin repeats (3 copies) [Caballeronia peredens]
MKNINEMLVEAAARGDLNKVKYCVNRRADINFDENEPIMEAALGGHLDVVDFILSNGGDSPYAREMTLGCASQNGHLHVVDHMLKVGAGDMIDAARVAAANGHIDVLKRLLDNGFNVQDLRCEGLWGAAGNGHVDVIRFLSEQGYDIACRNGSALVYAAGGGDTYTVSFFLERGITASLNDAADWAARSGNLSVLKLLFENGLDAHDVCDECLHNAAGEGQLNVVEFFLEIGPSSEALNFALESATAHSRLNVIKSLVEAGADVRYRDDSCIGLAASLDFIETTVFFLDQYQDSELEQILAEIESFASPTITSSIANWRLNRRLHRELSANNLPSTHLKI